MTSYIITNSTPAVTLGGCTTNTQSGSLCGQYNFTVPDNLVLGNYSVTITSTTDSTAVGYSDIVTIVPANYSQCATPLSSGSASSTISGSASGVSYMGSFPQTSGASSVPYGLCAPLSSTDSASMMSSALILSAIPTSSAIVSMTTST